MHPIINPNHKNQLHVAIIMDGNGRWASRQGKPRFRGHQAGARQVDQVVEAAVQKRIDVLTLFAFSSDNWQRPKKEVEFLMQLMQTYLKTKIKKCITNGVKLSVIGRRDRLKPGLVKLIETAEKQTKNGDQLHLRVAIDYSARDTILQAALRTNGKKDFNRDDFASLFYHCLPAPDVDFLIRTGGEKRLSDFLLWECAYAELYFSDVLWPDFDKHCFFEALENFNMRERRFGRLFQLKVV